MGLQHITILKISRFPELTVHERGITEIGTFEVYGFVEYKISEYHSLQIFEVQVDRAVNHALNGFQDPILQLILSNGRLRC